jgi:hypothetical protein
MMELALARAARAPLVMMRVLAPMAETLMTLALDLVMVQAVKRKTMMSVTLSYRPY